MKVAAVVGDFQHVPNAYIACGFGRLVIGLDAAQIAGPSRQSSRLEKARGPQPFVHAHRGHRFITGR